MEGTEKNDSCLNLFDVNRPFPSSLVPLFQSASKCETILMKMTLICMKILHAELYFHMKGFALRLVLKQRHKGTRNWPIVRMERMVMTSCPPY